MDGIYRVHFRVSVQYIDRETLPVLVRSIIILPHAKIVCVCSWAVFNLIKSNLTTNHRTLIY